MSAFGNGLTMDHINSTVFKAMQQKEQDLKSAVQNAGENPTTADLLQLQQDMQQWSMLTQVQSTVVKELADAMKGVIQKAA